ncbi:MAG TPA: hypothetical protein VNT54_19125 [Solirubrobacteraceae bacterium]|nr:hypothetical protein [Solirubrobacteraceae bacterium]
MPITNEQTTTSAAGLREQLVLLERERATAMLAEIAGNELYMTALREELQALRSAYAGAAITQIASLRSALDGPLVG